MKKLTILLAAVLISTAAFSQGGVENQFYFRFGYSIPSWKQFGATKDDWSDDMKKKGFMGELGSIFMLNSIPMPDGMAIGINVDYLSFYWHQFSYDRSNSTMDIATLRVDSKVGPSFTYCLTDKIAFDAYVKADISWITATAFVYDDDADDADGYGKIGAVGLSTGINVRLSVVMLGFEFNTISPKLEDVDNAGEYLGNINDRNSDKSPLPSITFSLGFSF